MSDPRDAEGPGFTFVDKRRRGEAAEAAPEPPRHEPPPPREAPPRETPRREAPREAPSPLDLGAAPGPAEATLTSLFAMFYSEGMAHLGQVPDPATGRRHLDLEQARFTIEMLDMLKQKTEGNRTPEESAVLEEVLAVLRMGYVQLSRRR